MVSTVKMDTAAPPPKEGSQPAAYLEVRVIHPRQTVFQIVTKLEAQLLEHQIQSFVAKDGYRILKIQTFKPGIGFLI